MHTYTPSTFSQNDFKMKNRGPENLVIKNLTENQELDKTHSWLRRNIVFLTFEEFPKAQLVNTPFKFYYCLNIMLILFLETCLHKKKQALDLFYMPLSTRHGHTQKNSK